MRASLFLAAIASMSAGLAAAGDLGLNQLKLGEDFRQASQASGAGSCTETRGTRKTLECRGASSALKPGFESVAGAQIRHLTLNGFGDTRKLEGISISFNAADFDAVRTSFAERYPALKCSDSSLQDKAGTKFSQTECSATLPEGRIRLERRAESMDISTLEIASPAWQAFSDAQE
jgi:hypothetical protein